MSSVALNLLTPWTWCPDWSAPVIERLEWYTNVLQAYRGEEQRRALRIEPRQMLEFTVGVSGDERRILEAVLFNRAAQLFALPIWPDGRQLQTSLSSGSSTIALDPAQYQFAVGDFVMLLGATPRDYEILTVATLSGNIGLSTPTTRTWAAGTWVLPVRPARIDGGLTLPRFTGADASLQLRFEMVDPASYTADAGATTYRSLPVFTQAIDWSTDPQMILERSLSVFDGGVGPVVVDDLAEIALPQQTGRYTLVSRSELDTWRKRLYALRGRQGAVWIPSGTDDLSVVAPISSGATTIDVRWCGYTDYLLNQVNRQDVRIVLSNGTVLYRRITAATEISTTVERLTIDAALGVDVAVNEVSLVSYMTLMRSESDAAEFAYWSGDVVETVASFRGFRHDL